jgi:hypothetical protein
MKKIWRGLSLILAICMTTLAMAQSGKLTGKLTDEKGVALRYANVALLKAADSAFVAGALVQEDGRFELVTPTPGRYLLKVSSIGFVERVSEAFEVSDASFSKDFGVLSLKTDVKSLSEVSVTALRPTITQLADRMVVSVEGTAMAAGNTAYAVLAKAPGVFIDHEGNIQLNGRGV